MNSLGEAAFFLNPAMSIEEVNDAALAVFATTRREVLGKPLAQVTGFDLFASPGAGNPPRWQHEFEKNQKTYQAFGSVLGRDTGMPGALVVISDISASRKMAEYIGKLEETNRDFDILFHFSHDGLVVCDGNAIGLKYNEAYFRITGIDGKDLIGKHMAEIVSMGDISESAILLALQERRQVTTMPTLKSGKRALITAIPVFDSGGDIVKIIGNVRDITELIALEAQLNQAKELSERYYSELVHLRNQNIQVEGLVAESPGMRNVVAKALKVAFTDAAVLITGESGAGKEVLARTIHQHSACKSGPFVKVNCGAIPDTLLESEFFGYEKGAFTNAAKKGKVGIFEIAVGGTLFLDEIGEIPLPLQAKLLGVLQDKRFTRVGGTKEIKLSARIVAATNRNLPDMVARGAFRKDLFYRLNVVGLNIPPLAERKEDIFPLAHYFLRGLNERYRFNNTLSPQVINAFLRYAWPGNVREMENLMEQLVVLAPNEQIVLDMLPEEIQLQLGSVGQKFSAGSSLEEMLTQFERKVFQNLIAQGLSSYKIAKALGINQSTAIRKIKKLGVRNAE